MPELGKGTPQSKVRFFHSYKNLAYHIAFSEVQNQELAEHIVAEVMTLMSRNQLIREDWTREEQKSVLALITEYRSIAAARTSHTGEKHAKRNPVPTTRFAGDDAVSAYGLAVSKIPTRDRIVLHLSVLYGLSEAQISNVLKMKKRSVSLRLHRALQFVVLHKEEEMESSPVAEDVAVVSNDEGVQESEPIHENSSLEVPTLTEDPAFQQALYLRLKVQLNTVEAVSNMDPHVFAPEQEESILTEMERSRPSFASLSSFSKLNEAQSRIAILFGILALVVILIFVALQLHDKNDARIQQEMASSLQEELNREKEDSVAEPVITETRKVPENLSAFYTDRLVFVDEKEDKLYEAMGNQEAKMVIDLQEETTGHGGIQYVGYQEDVIYLAFIDGTGGTVSGNPATFASEPYWQEWWFDGQLQVPSVKSVMVDQVEFRFDVEPLNAEDTDSSESEPSESIE